MTSQTLTLTLTAKDGATELLTVPYPAIAAGGTAIQSYSDLSLVFARHTFFNPAVALPPDFQTVSTPQGPGFQFVISDTADVAPWDSTMKAVLAQKFHSGQAPMLDETPYTYNFYLNLPSTQKIVTSWNGGVLWEFHDAQISGPDICLDNRGSGGPGTWWRLNYPNGSGGLSTIYPSAVTFDTWHHFQISLRWSLTTTGYYKLWLDGTQLINKTNCQTRTSSGGVPYLQFGLYADVGALAKSGSVPSVGTNQVTIAGITMSNN